MATTAHHTRRYATDPEYREKCKARSKAWRETNKERVRVYNAAYRCIP